MELKTIQSSKILFVDDENTLNEMLFFLNEQLARLELRGDPNSDVEVFINCLCAVIETYTVRKSYTARRSPPPWFDGELRKSIVKRNSLFRKSREKANFLEAFRNQRKVVRELVKTKKKRYYDDRFRHLISNKKSFFEELKKLAGRTKCRRRIDLKTSDGVISHDQQVADFFNSYFSTIGSTIQSPSPPGNPETPGASMNSLSMFLTPVTNREIYEILMNLNSNKSPGLDGISAKVLKLMAPAITSILTSLVNLSFETAIFPDCLKIAKVCPIYKGGNVDDVSNYRPISILPVISKLFERAMFNRLFNFVDKLLYRRQFGFRPKFSTVSALAEMTEKLRQNYTLQQFCIFLDFSKAFDTITHSKLLDKMERMGVRGLVQDWFRSYLKDRKQLVEVNGKQSQYHIVDCGVPQGSILGPLLFVIYVNDLPDQCRAFEVYMFADDTNLMYSSPVFDDSAIGSDIHCLMSWFHSNNLRLNVKKSQLIWIRNKKPREIELGSEKLPDSLCVKYLGVVLDTCFTFKSHIDTVVNKMSSHVFVLLSIRKAASKNVLLAYYKSYIQPIISYCLLIYGSTSVCTLAPIFKMQKKLLRIINFKGPRDTSLPLFQNCNILNVYDLYLVELTKFTLFSINGLFGNEYLNRLYVQRTSRDTRSVSKGMYVVPRVNTTFDKHSLSRRGSILLNFFLKKNLLREKKLSRTKIYNFVENLKQNVLYKEDLFQHLFN